MVAYGVRRKIVQELDPMNDLEDVLTVDARSYIHNHITSMNGRQSEAKRRAPITLWIPIQERPSFAKHEYVFYDNGTLYYVPVGKKAIYRDGGSVRLETQKHVLWSVNDRVDSIYVLFTSQELQGLDDNKEFMEVPETVKNQIQPALNTLESRSTEMVAYGVRRKIIREFNGSALNQSMDVNTTSYNTILSTSTNGNDAEDRNIVLRVHRDLWDKSAYVYVLVATDAGTLFHLKAQRDERDKEVIYTDKLLPWQIGDGFTPIYVLFTSQPLEGITAVSDVDKQTKQLTRVSDDLKKQIQPALKELQYRAEIDERRRFWTKLMSRKDMEHYLVAQIDMLRKRRRTQGINK